MILPAVTPSFRATASATTLSQWMDKAEPRLVRKIVYEHASEDPWLVLAQNMTDTRRAKKATYVVRSWLFARGLRASGTNSMRLLSFVYDELLNAIDKNNFDSEDFIIFEFDLVSDGWGIRETEITQVTRTVSQKVIQSRFEVAEFLSLTKSQDNPSLMVEIQSRRFRGRSYLKHLNREARHLPPAKSDCFFKAYCYASM